MSLYTNYQNKFIFFNEFGQNSWEQSADLERKLRTTCIESD